MTQSDDPTQWLFHGRPEHAEAHAALQVAEKAYLRGQWKDVHNTDTVGDCHHGVDLRVPCLDLVEMCLDDLDRADLALPDHRRQREP